MKNNVKPLITHHQLPIIQLSHLPSRYIKCPVDRNAIHRQAFTLMGELYLRRFITLLDAKVHEVGHLFPIRRADEKRFDDAVFHRGADGKGF